ncbi:hemolysin XhlA family protein [Clostridium baratii]|uniref:Hemolysin XhlA family protein n=1 Tax=Clostridium baratii str. Sullivan TaxID=1415775 RepID=A0A0A7FUD0_9CLOT|nr:hemolysin XhlA family protein [Clostridium baratii]AIY83224.1 hemolysin XhlA family protein [Clostridium baratii str. Sullivan]
MNEELIKDKLKTHDTRLNNHADRIDKLEQGQAEFRIQIQNLCKSLEGLTNVLKWGLGFLITGFVTFFFYAIQNHLFK